MKLSFVLPEDAVFPAVEASSDKQVFLKFASYIALKTGKDSHEIAEALAMRERLGSTACGKGVAIPHVSLAGLGEVMCAFVCLSAPVSFNAADGRMVDLFFAIFAPKEQDGAGEHLRLLSQMVRVFRHADFCDTLRQSCGSRKTIHRLILEAAEG